MPNYCLGALGYLFILDQRKEGLLLALQYHFQQHLVSHPETDQDQPYLASEASQQWGAGWYAAGMQIDTTVGSIEVNMGQHPCGTLWHLVESCYMPNQSL